MQPGLFYSLSCSRLVYPFYHCCLIIQCSLHLSTVKSAFTKPSLTIKSAELSFNYSNFGKKNMKIFPSLSHKINSEFFVGSHRQSILKDFLLAQAFSS